MTILADAQEGCRATSKNLLQRFMGKTVSPWQQAR
jgi:hypothetical protein